MTTQCPVCQGTAASGGQAVAYADIWTALEAEFRLTVPNQVMERYTPAPTTVLAACSSCGLRFFSPVVAAGPDFYSLLETNGYYNEVTWEGAAVVAEVDDREDVVDFGCGDGAMLRALPTRRSGRRVGVDHHETAVASLRRAGIEAYSVPFDVFASREQARFDVACALQVLEHLPDVSVLVEACSTVLRPQGRLYLAVPNGDRLVGRFEPQDCPPHHISRWRERDVHMLAERFGFDVVRVDREPIHNDMRRLVVRRALERRLRLGRAGAHVARGLARVAPAPTLPRAVGALAPAVEVCGHSLLAELRLPDAPSGTWRAFPSRIAATP